MNGRTFYVKHRSDNTSDNTLANTPNFLYAPKFKILEKSLHLCHIEPTSRNSRYLHCIVPQYNLLAKAKRETRFIL